MITTTKQFIKMFLENYNLMTAKIVVIFETFKKVAINFFKALA